MQKDLHQDYFTGNFTLDVEVKNYYCLQVQ